MTDILQIWIDNPLSLAHRWMMRRALDMADTYTLITNRPEIIQAFPSAIIIDADDYHSHCLRSCQAPEWWRIYADRRPQFKSDFMRMMYLIEHQATVYADSDLELFTLPEAIVGPKIAENIGRICLMTSGGEPGWIKRFMSICTSTPPGRIFLPFLAGDEYREGRVEAIPHYCFHHWKLGSYKR